MTLIFVIHIVLLHDQHKGQWSFICLQWTGESMFQKTQDAFAAAT